MTGFDTIRERHKDCGDSAGGCVIYVDNDTGDLVSCDTRVVLDDRDFWEAEAQRYALEDDDNIRRGVAAEAHAKALAKALRHSLDCMWLLDRDCDGSCQDARQALAAYDKDHER